LLLIAAILGVFGYAGYPYVETARLWHSVIGIDVSHHQGVIDWPRVAQAGVQFAYIKATEGGDFADKRFRENWKGAETAGIPRGAYHFFTQCRSGEEQARNFISVVPRDPVALPPALDAEHMGSCRDAKARFDPVAEIEAFLRIVEAHFGCRPLVYTTPEFERSFLREWRSPAAFWVRSVYLPPFYKRDRWVFWQYHNAGRRDGISGAVDLNAFRGGAEEFARFLAAKGCR
jgi:lysozyme